MNELVLVTDIGSTSTKALLLQIAGDSFVPVESADEPTTVEKPHEDVRVGLFRAVDRIAGRARVPLRHGDRFLVPYYTTSSAGGGLQILVIALASWDTGVVARAVTCGAGGVVLDSFTIDDETPRVQKIQRMSTLSPDLVVMAGGYEDGAVAAVVNMAQLLALASPRPKYGPGRLPVVFCGNTRAGEFVKEALGDRFELHFTENIRPSGSEFNMRPAIAAVHGLFMNHVMQMAPGYRRVAEAAAVPVIPTPSGVERIMALYARERAGSLMLADMGGATTDVFSLVGQDIQRTVSANIGMSYSLSNILREAGSGMVMRHLPGADESDVRNRILQKTLFPTIPPTDHFGGTVEHACAAEGMRLAFRQHMDFSYRRARVGFLDRLRLTGACKFDQRFRTLDEKRSFSLSEFGTLIGAGGVLSHADPVRSAWILAQGFRPRGVTTLMVDSRFHSPHMGILSTIHPEMALEYYTASCLKPVCRVVTPLHGVKEGRSAMTVRGPEGEVTVAGGDFLFLRNGKGCRAGDWEEQDDIPLLVDCGTVESPGLPIDFQRTPVPVSSGAAAHSRSTVLDGPVEMEHTFDLPYPGEILVAQGERVAPGTLLGQNRLSPPMVYFIDLRGSQGYTGELSTHELLKNVTVLPGDVVSPGMTVSRRRTVHGIVSAVHDVKSPVRGMVTGVVPPGLICLREIQDYDGKPHVVPVTVPLGLKPKQINRVLRVRKGDFVLRGQSLAVGGSQVAIKSPTAGTVTDVSRLTGTVTVQYVTNPVRMESPVNGTVLSLIPERWVRVGFRGMRIEGVLGLGRNVHGVISTSYDEGALVMLENPVTSDDMRRAQESRAAALICPAIPAGLLAAYLGYEPGVILTGGEDLPFSILAVRGAGSVRFEAEAWQRLAALQGSHGAVFTTTRIRAGVERPWLLSEQQ